MNDKDATMTADRVNFQLPISISITNPNVPTNRNGKICYLEMPATDVAKSAEFYSKVFGWNIRKRVTEPPHSTIRRAK
jgi:hypothetical protein